MPFLCRLSRWGQGFVSVFFVCQPTQGTLAKTFYGFGFGFGDRDAICEIARNAYFGIGESHVNLFLPEYKFRYFDIVWLNRSAFFKMMPCQIDIF